ncbi:MAG TPA: phosphoribosylanthranilate isomerase [Candidatus Limnocylindria bacterium]|nr:phosphoribosylanthranilate isomerase [Candidatus Limnocylindria bacterium]
MTIEDSHLGDRRPPLARTRVKICGITDFPDALLAVAAGADALGFVFYPESPRFLRPAAAAAICRALPPFVARVGLFVNASAEEVRSTVAESGIDTVQFHGDESPEFCRQWLDRLRVLKAFRVRDRHSLIPLATYVDAADAFLLDAYVHGVPGGTGTTFNWDLARDAASLGRPIILAGGLTPANVGAAVAAVGPFAVDVSSGVERAPGKKDRTKVVDFIRAATEK